MKTAFVTFCRFAVTPEGVSLNMKDLFQNVLHSMQIVSVTYSIRIQIRLE